MPHQNIDKFFKVAAILFGQFHQIFGIFGLEQGLEQGRKEGENKNLRENIISLLEFGMSDEEISKALKIDIKFVKSIVN